MFMLLVQWQNCIPSRQQSFYPIGRKFHVADLKLLILTLCTQTYKRNPIHFYDPHKAPLLDHYRSVPKSQNHRIWFETPSRLKVPAIRSVLEYLK